jgi:ABC-type dipeptide/oligopeptide/nickel transport system permease component
MLGPIAVNMLVGSFFIEAIFRIPGIGAQMTLATYNRDYPVIMALALLWTFVLAFTYLLSDLMYAWVDPRIRLGQKA